MGAIVFFIILFFILVIGWFALDFQLGRKMHLKVTETIESPVLYGSLEIFSTGKELFTNYWEQLKKAQTSIDIVFYIVRNDTFSEEFLSILKKKAREGVRVRLLLDRIGSFKFSKKNIRALKGAGVEFKFDNQIRLPFLFYSSQIRNHRKITVIDGVTGYLGGFNVGKEYIDLDPKLSPWRDYHLKMTGEGAAYLQQVFNQDWQTEFPWEVVKRSHATQNTSVVSTVKHTDGHDGTLIAHTLVSTEANLLETYYLQQLRSAQTSILIGTPYFIPSKQLFEELLAVLHRGVKLTVIVPATADHPLVQEASYRYFRPLLRAGAKVYQYNNGFYHAKTVIIDDNVCEIGTANFDKRSLFLNKEINCYTFDTAFKNKLMEIIRKDIGDSKLLKLAQLEKPSLFRSLKEVIANAIAYFL